jgi:acyl-CoA synthetase (AMP-forming)/AMP-acid ligase II
MEINSFLSRVTDNINRFRASPFVYFSNSQEQLTLTWGDIGETANRFLSLYRARGLSQSQPILIFCRHHPDMYGSFLGAMFGGYIPSFMPCLTAKQNPNIFWESHRLLLERLQPTAVLGDRSTLNST